MFRASTGIPREVRVQAQSGLNQNSTTDSERDLRKILPYESQFPHLQNGTMVPPSMSPGGAGTVSSSRACEGLCQPQRSASLLSVTCIPLDLRPAR